MPQFPGGDGALMTFVANSINYPPDGELVGKTVIKFIITKDGFINNIKVLQSFDPICDKEAIRVINLLPKWIPGEHNGKKVNVYYTLPVIFRLQQ